MTVQGNPDGTLANKRNNSEAGVAAKKTVPGYPTGTLANRRENLEAGMAIQNNNKIREKRVRGGTY